MATTLPYVISNKNLDTLFAKIAGAKIPAKFNRDFLHTTIGLKASNDRAYIPLLRTLGFIDSAGTPTSEYAKLKNSATAKRAIRDAVRRAYAPLFEANEAANTLTSEKLKGLVSQVAGTDDSITARIAWTFSTLAKLADFSESADDNVESDDAAAAETPVTPILNSPVPQKGLRPEFHYNIQVHLPANGTEEVYLNIFNALRKAFQ